MNGTKLITALGCLLIVSPCMAGQSEHYSPVLRNATKESAVEGALDGALVRAAKEIVFKGDQVGMGKVVREEYAKLVKKQLGMLTKAASENNKN